MKESTRNDRKWFSKSKKAFLKNDFHKASDREIETNGCECCPHCGPRKQLCDFCCDVGFIAVVRIIIPIILLAQ